MKLMKKYRLKEEAKKYFPDTMHKINSLVLEEWQSCYDITLEALEEVPQRIELSWYGSSVRSSNGIQKYPLEPFTDNERAICEKALNGELLDIDSLDDRDFNNWYNDEDNSAVVDLHSYGFKNKGIKAVLKAYLKETK